MPISVRKRTCISLRVVKLNNRELMRCEISTSNRA